MPRSNGSKTTTRRRLLAGSAAGVAVVAVDAVMPATANAADGDNLKIGQENTAANTTRLSSDDGGLHVVADTDDAAVVGESTSSDGYGLRGTAPYIGVVGVGDQIGVYTVSDYGVGVHALTYDGTAIRAQTAVPQGTALRVEGVASFTRSGTVTVPAGARTAKVSVSPISSETLVFASSQRRLAGTHIEAAVPDAANGSFTVHLNRRAPQAMPVAWFLLG
jgi:hypothetical protein